MEHQFTPSTSQSTPEMAENHEVIDLAERFNDPAKRKKRDPGKICIYLLKVNKQTFER